MTTPVKLTISRAEAWWLTRRRIGMTQASFARTLDISEEDLRDLEAGRGMSIPMPNMGALKARPLSLGEQCALYRRRKGWTLPRLARALGVSRQTVWKAEHDQTGGVRRVLVYWTVGGPPSPDGSGPISVRADTLLATSEGPARGCFETGK